MSKNRADTEATFRNGFPLLRRFYGWMGMKSAHQRERERIAEAERE